MPDVRETHLAPKHHAAVERWRDAFLPDFDFLMDKWPEHFPKQAPYKLCAYREQGLCGEVEVGDAKGQPKAKRACDLAPEQAHNLFGAIRAQASTEFGSIQQHRLTLARAQSEEEQIWVLRMMAEELRHGYQMLHLLTDDDWSIVTDESADDLVENALSMQTGSHILGAFNIDFDSFVDNIVFCALIDRVGKYQLAMQKVSAYQPMAESMPPMLREEAFHLATGVVPMRRWASAAGRGEVFVTMDTLQKAINKWLPRGLEMFGDERGGGTNVRLGLKPMKNAEAQALYVDEIRKVIDDLNVRFLRARFPDLGRNDAEDRRRRIADDGARIEGVGPEDLLRMPHADFFRRRGVPAFRMVGVDGETYDDFDAYSAHLRRQLPDAYLAGRDFRDFFTTLSEVASGALSPTDASRRMPSLRRVAGSCPCSRSVRWVVDAPSAPMPASTANAATA
ncbi:MAG: Phenylacetic acid catabolic protein [Acidobacteriota bacterium]